MMGWLTLPLSTSCELQKGKRMGVGIEGVIDILRYVKSRYTERVSSFEVCGFRYVSIRCKMLLELVFMDNTN